MDEYYPLHYPQFLSKDDMRDAQEEALYRRTRRPGMPPRYSPQEVDALLAGRTAEPEYSTPDEVNAFFDSWEAEGRAKRAVAHPEPDSEPDNDADDRSGKFSYLFGHPSGPLPTTQPQENDFSYLDGFSQSALPADPLNSHYVGRLAKAPGAGLSPLEKQWNEWTPFSASMFTENPVGEAPRPAQRGGAGPLPQAPVVPPPQGSKQQSTPTPAPVPVRPSAIDPTGGEDFLKRWGPSDQAAQPAGLAGPPPYTNEPGHIYTPSQEALPEGWIEYAPGVRVKTGGATRGGDLTGLQQHAVNYRDFLPDPDVTALEGSMQARSRLADMAERDARLRGLDAQSKLLESQATDPYGIGRMRAQAEINAAAADKLQKSALERATASAKERHSYDVQRQDEMNMAWEAYKAKADKLQRAMTMLAPDGKVENLSRLDKIRYAELQRELAAAEAEKNYHFARLNPQSREYNRPDAQELPSLTVTP